MAHERLLIVEDENIIAKDIQRRLTRLGYSVPAIASSGRDALQKTATVHPDLILMDIVLKGDMDGVDTAAGRVATILTLQRSLPSAAL